MNCKIGDLAIIVSCPFFPENISAIVEVIRASETPDNEWVIRSVSRRLVGFHPVMGWVSRHTEAHIPDSSLKPISGLPDAEDTDEALPTKRTDGVTA